ncbi:MAG: hypothetical protein SFZ03_04475 [Candidatus Melainabacteria bacterium]|nr:hypothetical protein [Candidatus Melainabacteria bacterium]
MASTHFHFVQDAATCLLCRYAITACVAADFQNASLVLLAQADNLRMMKVNGSSSAYAAFQ